ncbi:hypothetical protein C1H46_032143 [Malus baccata]|uniref:Uncharacterized protein n=1 Tax=Malus baccata TaxID=106549 RepID=A0A540L7M0_MALBA|nr:hypothetical protein C1H46_032143 [Malus baccata]
MSFQLIIEAEIKAFLTFDAWRTTNSLWINVWVKINPFVSKVDSSTLAQSCISIDC